MNQASAEFKSSLTLPDNSMGSVYCYSGLLGAVAGVISVAYYAIKSEPLALLAVPVLMAFVYLFFRAIFTSTLSSISISGDSIILANVPTFSIWIGNAIVPLIIKKQFSINKSEFELEWMGQSLTWNDLKSGKSVHLAHSAEAQPLLDWFTVHGISIPPKPL